MKRIDSNMRWKLWRSWTLQLFVRHGRHLNATSVWRYRKYLARRSRGTQGLGKVFSLNFRRRFGGDLWLRENSSDDDTLHEVFVRRVYEPAAREVEDCRYIIDIGANIGLATRFFVGRCPGARIFAIEPDVGNYELLERNLARLKETGRCATMRAAAWSERTMLDLSEPPLGTGFDSIQASAAKSMLEPAVMGLTVADIIDRSGFPEVDLLKMDIEGGEAEVFAGDLQWLRSVKVIAVEFHEDARRRSGFDGLMELHGFDVREGNDHTVVAVRKQGVVASAMKAGNGRSPQLQAI